MSHCLVRRFLRWKELATRKKIRYDIKDRTDRSRR